MPTQAKILTTAVSPQQQQQQQLMSMSMSVSVALALAISLALTLLIRVMSAPDMIAACRSACSSRKLSLNCWVRVSGFAKTAWRNVVSVESLFSAALNVAGLDFAAISRGIQYSSLN